MYQEILKNFQKGKVEDWKKSGAENCQGSLKCNYNVEVTTLMLNFINQRMPDTKGKIRGG